MVEKKGDFLSKDYSVTIKGIAICFMVWHHLFGFPERIHVPYAYCINIGNVSPELILGYFGRICIAFFAFLSGYGLSAKMAKTDVKNAGDYVKQSVKLLYHTLKGFYLKYWIVFILFIPYGLATVYKLDWTVFLKNFIGSSCSYNAEWWYVAQFVKMVMMFPILWWLIKQITKGAESTILYILGIIITFLLIYFNLVDSLIVWFCFAQGIFIQQMDLFNRIHKLKIFRKQIFSMMIGIALLVTTAFVRIVTLSNCDYDYIYVPILIFAIVVIFNNSGIGKYLGIIFSTLGKYSTTIWLTHTFFAYYYFQKVAYMPYYSWLIFLWVMVICTAIGIIVDWVYQGIGKCGKKYEFYTNKIKKDN